jgi:hypothetical protein
MALRDEHGNSEDVVLPGPGGTIRVVVGEPGRQSGVWRIWAPPTKFDVYIGVRAILGYQKWSLYETGDWRHAWLTDEKARAALSGHNAEGDRLVWDVALAGSQKNSPR